MSDTQPQAKKAPEDHFGLRFFGRGVLEYYKTNVHLYEIHERDFGATLSVTESADEAEAPYLHVEFGFRKLKGGGVCIGPWPPDVMKMKEIDLQRWRPWLLPEPELVPRDEDSGWLTWVGLKLEGKDEVPPDPLGDIEREVQLTNALTMEASGKPLWKKTWGRAIARPAAENGKEYARAHEHLSGLLVDEIDIDVLGALAHRFKVTLKQPAKSMNSIMDILESFGKKDLWTPIKDSWNERSRVHGTGDTRFEKFPAAETFESDLTRIVKALREIRVLLEEKLDLSADACEAKCTVLNGCTGKIVASVRPEMKVHTFKAMEGKQIARIECGVVASRADWLENEALIIHFTDGSGIAIRADAACELEDPMERAKHLSGFLSPKNFPATRRGPAPKKDEPPPMA